MISTAHLQAACCDLVADVARSHGTVQLKVAGASMVPALWPGDMVTVRRCDLLEIEPDRIIVFRQNERLIVHRMLRWAGDRVVARGDARSRCDEPVRTDEVLGRVESILRNGRPVSPRHSYWQRAIALVMRHSEWFGGLFLRLGSRIQRLGVSEANLNY